MLTPNTILQARYRIICQLAQGGMGTVYEAVDERLDTTIALKECHFTDEKLRKQFEREARLLARLRHPAMTRVIDHFNEGDGQFLVMDFIAGEDLSEMLLSSGGVFPPERVLEWADQLLDALSYLHRQEPPIVHRDIKPQNLKLADAKQIILLDFGLAKGFAGQVSRVATTGSIFGYTPNYAPLEQIQGTGTDPRSDLYSLAATLYHLITGVVPPDVLTRLTATSDGDPDPLSSAHEVNRAVSPGVASVLHQAMAVGRNNRFATADEMRAALKKALPLAVISAVTQLPETVVGSAAESESEQETELLPPQIANTVRSPERQWPVATVAAGTVASPRVRDSDSTGESESSPGILTPASDDEEQAGRRRVRWYGFLLGLIVGLISFPIYRKNFYYSPFTLRELEFIVPCGIFGTAFGFIWPEGKWKWGLLLGGVPTLLTFLDIVEPDLFARGGPMFLITAVVTLMPLVAASIGSYTGSRLSTRRLPASRAEANAQSARHRVRWYFYLLALTTGVTLPILVRYVRVPGIYYLFSFSGSFPALYGFVAIIFGFLWPQLKWKWGLLLGAGLVLLEYPSVMDKLRHPASYEGVVGAINWEIFLTLLSLAAACIGSYVGFRLSKRRRLNHPR